jgi:hypothetical protein
MECCEYAPTGLQGNVSFRLKTFRQPTPCLQSFFSCRFEFGSAHVWIFGVTFQRTLTERERLCTVDLLAQASLDLLLLIMATLVAFYQTS